MDKQIETGKSKALTDYPRAQWRIDDDVNIYLSHFMKRRLYPISRPDTISQIPGMDKQSETGKSKALTDYPRAQWRIDDGVKICLSHCLTRRIYQLSPPLARGPFNSFTRLLRPCPLHQITSHD